jgi:RNA polymerase sigma-70 factor (ECF subfamily)
VSNPYFNLKDEKLMELYQDDNMQAFEVIYSRFERRVYSYISKRVKDKEVVADIFQNALTKFHRSRDLYDPKYPLISWFYTITKSELLDYAKKKRDVFVNLTFEIEDIQNEKMDLLDLENESLLTNNEKKAIELRYYEDKGFNEISKILETSESNIRKVISRGIKKLKVKYRGQSL